MNEGQVFVAAASKQLSRVEIDLGASNQHELAAGALRPMLLQLGLLEQIDSRLRVEARVHRLEDDEEPFSVHDVLTVYDARRRSPDRPAEWRLYYGSTRPSEELLQGMRAGDLLAFLVDRDLGVHLVVTSAGSQWSRVLESALALRYDRQMRLTPGEDLQQRQSTHPLTLIADQMGLGASAKSDEEWLSEHFGGQWPADFPTTYEMAGLAHLRAGLDATSHDADSLVTAWLETETRLFYVLEENEGWRRIASCRTFDDHVSVAMSVLQRRRARRGASLEHHLEELFRLRGVKHERQVVTESGSRSDFIFPSGDAYRDEAHPAGHLIHLGAKSTARERWKQLLSEAARVEKKHLVTLDAKLSHASLDAMSDAGVDVVMPASIARLYGRDDLMTLEDFLARAGKPGATAAGRDA